MKLAAHCLAILLISAPVAARGQAAGAAAPRSRGGGDSRAAETTPGAIPSTSTEAANADVAAGHRFRRVYVPESELLDRLQRGQRYVPMDAAEFDDRVRRARAANRNADDPIAQIAYAHYTASLDSAFRLKGVGTWQVNLAGKNSALLDLPGLGIALRDPRWTAAKGQASASEPAKLGVTERGGAALYADRSGTVEFSWLLAGLQERDLGWTYELSFPPSPAQRIELALPADLIPSIDGAIISASQADGESRRHWTIDLLGRSNAQLRLSTHDGREISQRLTLLRPKLTYEVSSHGLQLSAELWFDVHGAPLQRLELDIDRRLTLLSAMSGDEEVPWTAVSDGEDDRLQRVVLDFPEPLKGSNRLVRLTAVGPLSTEPGWTLPGIDARDVAWQDGTIALAIARPLSLARLDLANCRQTKRESLPAPAAGEAIGIQAFGASAAITMHVAPRSERLELTSATTIELLGNEAVGSYAAEIVARQGERFQLAADVSPDWIIDSVQSSPAGMIADWDLRRTEGTASLLIIHLAKAINKDRPLRLVVQATRRRAPLGETLEVQDLRLLAFDAIAPTRRLALLNTTAPYRLDLRGADDLTRLDPAGLNASDRSLVGDKAEGLLFVMDEAAADLQINMLQERPRFSASLETRVTVTDSDLKESCQLHITPESNELDHVLLHFSQTRSIEPEWAIANGDAEPLAARQLSREEQTARGIADNGETWEVRFRPARTAPFVLLATRTSRIRPDMPVSLPSMLGATSQQGKLFVELAADFIPGLQERRLKPLAVEPPAAGDYQNVLAAYEYDPTEDLLVAKEPALILRMDGATAQRRPAWVWRCTLDAWFSPSQQVEHRASLLVENTGRSRISITLPSATLPSLKVDRTTVAAATWDRETQKLDVSLPAGRRFCLVEVRWIGGTAALGGISSRTLEWPMADVPILNRRATVWLPAGYVLAETGVEWRAAPTATVSWRERLLGPLGRPDGRETFEPWLADDWSTLNAEPHRAGLAAEWVDRFLGQAVQQGSAERLPQRSDEAYADHDTWGDQLYRAWYSAAGDERSPPAPLFVHVESLRQANILPSTSLDWQTGRVPHEPPTIRAALRQRGLVLLVSRQAVVLTTRQWAASWCDPAIAPSQHVAFNVAPEKLSSRLFASEDAAAAPQVTPLETWLSLTEYNRSVWPTADQRDAGDLPSEGWVAYPLEWPTNEARIDLLIVRRNAVTAFGVGLFLATVGAVWRWGFRQPVNQVIALGVVIIVALSLPPAFASLGAAIVLGFLGGRCCRWLRPQGMAAGEPEVAIPQIAAVATSFLVVSLLWASSLAAQERPEGEGQGVSDRVFDVVIPIDESENVSGDKVYVPEALYQVLMAHTNSRPQDVRYLITSAEYESTGEALDRGDGSSALQNWKARLTVEVLRSPARVHLPLGSIETHIVPASGRLNGESLLFGWDEARESIDFEVKSAGTAKVEFEFQPARPNGAARGVSFAIPRVPQSSLRLPLANTSAPPRIVAVGGSRVDAASKQLMAELGPIGQVSAMWTGSVSRAEPPPQFDSEELAWLKLRPGSTVLNARITVQVRRGELKEVSLKLDDRLQPLPLGKDSLIDSIERVSANELRLRFASPLTKRSVLDIGFVLKGTMGVGRFAWPNIELAGAQTRRRFIACTWDPSLELVSPFPAEWKPLNSAQFAALWGESEARPPAFELPAATTPAWQLDVRPRQAKLTSSYRTVVETHLASAELRWDAAIDVSGGSRFQLRTTAPADLDIERVEIRDAAGIRPSRWSQSDRTLTVFPDAAATGKLELSVRARLPVGKKGRLVVPQLRVDESTEEAASLFILRSSSVLAELDEPGKFRELATAQSAELISDVVQSAPDNSVGRRMRPVAAYDVKNTHAPIVVVIQKNQPHVEAVQAVSLARPDDSWVAALDLKLSVSGGVLDAVRIEAPASWSPPFRIEPAMPLEVVEAPGESRRQLLVVPPSAITGEVQLRIAGRLLPTAGQRIRAPDARVVGASTLKQYFALPSQHELQALAWETRGLKPDKIPSGLVSSVSGGDTVQTYSRAADQLQAELRAVERLTDEVQVRLADIAVSWASDSLCYGTASFDIEPAGRKSCLLALPAGHNLIHLSVEGCPRRITPAGAERWQVPLSGGRLPQRIEMVYTGRLSGHDGVRAAIEGPKLIGLPVERTLWSVSGPRFAGIAAPAAGDSAPAVRIEAARYETIAGLIESAAITLSEVTTDETPRWYTAWARRMLAARDTLEHTELLWGEADRDGETTARIEMIDQDQQRLAERLGTDDVLDELWLSPQRPESAIAVWEASLGRTHAPMRAMFLGERSTLALSYERQSAGDLASRAVHMLVAAAILLAAVALIRYTLFVDWFADRPRAVGVAAGLFWWLFIWPSALGWLIVATSLAFPYLASFSWRRWRPPWSPRRA